MHFVWLLRHHKFSVIFDGYFFETEEAQVREYRIQGHIVSVGAHRIALEKCFCEHFQEVLVPDTAIEYLLNKDFLIWVLKCSQVVVGMRVNGVDHRVERLYALNAFFK